MKLAELAPNVPEPNTVQLFTGSVTSSDARTE